jgi:predicted enzyme related to lactoylglutathione lyase
MGTRFWSVVFDANDHVALARFWSDALGWSFGDSGEDTSYVRGEDERVPRLEFVPSSEPKLAKNRLHLDLSTTSDDHHDITVERLLGLGARHVDIGQHDITWTVLADPEGNELCVLRPDKDYGQAAPIGTICLDADDVRTMASFWSAATGWPITRLDRVAVLHAGVGPTFVMGPKVAPKPGKNRLHFDVAPPADGDQGAEVERLIALGARRVDIGQGDVPWVVLTDPEGNEFCVLTPR